MPLYNPIDLTPYQPISEKDQPSGYPGLDINGIIPTLQVKDLDYIRQSEIDRQCSGLGGNARSSSLITAIEGTSVFNIAPGFGYVNDHTGIDGTYKRIDFVGGTNIPIVGNGINYISINTLGNVSVSLTKEAMGTHIYLGHISVMSGVIFEIFNTPEWIGHFPGRINEFITDGIKAIIAEGLELTEPSPLTLNISAGEIYVRLSAIDISEQSTFHKIYNNNGTWAEDVNNLNYVDVTQWNDVTSGLVTMTDQYYKVDLVIVVPDGFVYYVYGQAEYLTKDEARRASLSTIPPEIRLDAVDIGILIIQKNSTSLANNILDIRPLFSRVFKALSPYDLPDYQFLPTHAGIVNLYNITEQVIPDGTINVPANKAGFYDDLKKTIVYRDIVANPALILTNNITNYITAHRETGTWVALPDRSAIDYIHYLPYARVYRSDNNVDIQIAPMGGNGYIESTRERLAMTDRYAREYGVDSIAVDSSLNITINGGKIWVVANSYNILPVTISTTWSKCYHDSNVIYNPTHWHNEYHANTPIIDNANYDNGTDLQALTTGYYTINYVYRGIENTDHLYIVLGDNEYASLDLAKASGRISSVPQLIETHTMFLGRIIVKQGSTTDITCESAFTTVFTASSAITSHGALTGLLNDDHIQYFNQLRGDVRYLQLPVPIAGQTKTKITYNSNGLVTAGTDATTADINSSTNRRYVTDAQLVVIGNTSNTNTGDQDLSGYQPLLMFTPEDITNKSTNTLLGISNTLYPTQNAVKSYVDTELGTKQPLDATLTALAGFNTNGLVTQIAVDTFTGRTITGTTNQITLTNGDGVAGNPIIAISDNIILPGTESLTLVTGTTSQRPVSPTVGMVRFNSTLGYPEMYMGTNGWVPTMMTGGRNWGILWDDFLFDISLTHTWTRNTSGTGAVIAASTIGVNPTDRALGVNSFSTGTTATGRSGFAYATSAILFGYGYHKFETRILIPTLSTSAQEFDCFIGFSDNNDIAGAGLNGVQFWYNRNVSTNWLISCSYDGTFTTTTTTTAVVAGAWEKLGIEVNEAGTLATFWIDDVQVGTISTNIPTDIVPTTRCGIGFKIAKSAGNTARTLLVDYCQHFYQLTTTR